MPDPSPSGVSASTAATKPGAWDRIGIALSGLCVVHCLALPVVLATLPLWPLAEHVHAWLHPVFAVVLIPTTAAAMWYGWRIHRQRSVLAFLGAGLLVVLAAGIIGHAAPGALLETSLTLAGSTLLITGHWRNWKSCENCRLAQA